MYIIKKVCAHVALMIKVSLEKRINFNLNYVFKIGIIMKIKRY